jgi:deoxyadenosine/deoxycytidine kinase
MGPTCAGKSTLMQVLKQRLPDKIGLVEVGKELRAKYPPSYFAGQNNPAHTAAEAWDLCVAGIKREGDAGRTHILIDGQPRDVPQVRKCLNDFPGQPKRFVLLTADLEVRRQRAIQGRGNDPENLELAMKRLTNDMIAYYAVLAELLLRGAFVDTYDTSGIENTEEAITELSRNIMGF